MKPSRRQVVLVAVAIVAAAGLSTAAYAAYRGVTTNNGNQLAAGSVALSDNDAGSALFTALGSARASDSETSCIRVRSDGSLDSTVRLYGTVSGGLAPFLTLTVTRGTDPAPSFKSCTSFIADGTSYIGAGPGVIYSGPLSSFPGSYAAGIVDPTAGSSETWSTSEVHVYRFSLSAGTNPAAEGLSATVSFTWEARNL